MKSFLEPHVRQRQRQRRLPGRARLRHHPVQDDRGRRTPGPDDVPDRPEGRRARGDQEPSQGEQKKEKERLDRAKKEKVPPPPPKFSAGPSWSRWRSQPGDREFFARAIVNRIWHRLFGRGLVMPLDQMHSANPPSHPELLAWLARDTIDHGYDLRRLIRGLVLSRAYARGSRWEGERAAPAVALRRGRSSGR